MILCCVFDGVVIVLVCVEGLVVVCGFVDV